MTDAEQADWITTQEAADLLRAHVDIARKVLKAMDCETREPSAMGFATLWRRADVLAVRDLRKFQRRTTRAAHAYDGPDYCSVGGAERLKARIEAYWRERGRTVMVRFVETAASNGGAPRVDIRSDMVDGSPVK